MFKGYEDGYTVVILNIEPMEAGLYGRITDSVLARLPLRNVTTHRSFIIDSKQGFVVPPPLPGEPLKNVTGQGIIIYGPTGDYVIVDFTDGPVIAFEGIKDPKCRAAMVMQFEELARMVEVHHAQFPQDSLAKLVPGYWSRNDYLTSATWDIQARYQESGFMPCPPYNGAISKLFFAGTVHDKSHRHVLHVLRHHPDFVLVEGTVDPLTGHHTIPISDKPDLYTAYADHAGCLGLRGTSGFCYREFDILCGGYPLFMHPFTHSTQMEPLIDNEHYFAVEFDANPEVFAQRIMDRFYQVRGDVTLLNRVRLGGQQWFHRNCEIPHITTRISQWIINTIPAAAIY